MFRIRVISSDGHECGVPVQVDGHPAETRPYVLNAIADSLMIDRKEIERVLNEGTTNQLRKHLSRFTKAQLKPRPHRSEQAPFLPFFPDD